MPAIKRPRRRLACEHLEPRLALTLFGSIAVVGDYEVSVIAGDQSITGAHQTFSTVIPLTDNYHGTDRLPFPSAGIALDSVSIDDENEYPPGSEVTRTIHSASSYFFQTNNVFDNILETSTWNRGDGTAGNGPVTARIKVTYRMTPIASETAKAGDFALYFSPRLVSADSGGCDMGFDQFLETNYSCSYVAEDSQLTLRWSVEGPTRSFGEENLRVNERAVVRNSALEGAPAITRFGETTVFTIEHEISGNSAIIESRRSGLRAIVLAHPLTDVEPLSLTFEKSPEGVPFLGYNYQIAEGSVADSVSLAMYWATIGGTKIPGLPAVFQGRTDSDLGPGQYQQRVDLSRLNSRPDDAIRLLLVVNEDRLVLEHNVFNNSEPVTIPCEAALFDSLSRDRSQESAADNIVLGFTPAFGLRVSQAATICGVDHFNFLNILEQLPDDVRSYRTSSVSYTYNAPSNIYYPNVFGDTLRIESNGQLAYELAVGNQIILKHADPSPLPDIDLPAIGTGRVFYNSTTQKFSVLVTPDVPDQYVPYYTEANTLASWHYANWILNDRTFYFGDAPFSVFPVNILNGREATFVTQLVGVDANHQLTEKWSTDRTGTRVRWKTNGAAITSVEALLLPAPERPWNNPETPLDVNNDAAITPLDALYIINELNASGPRNLMESSTPFPQSSQYFDVDGDGYLAPIDALLVINHINAGGSGEAEPAPISAPKHSHFDESPTDWEVAWFYLYGTNEFSTLRESEAATFRLFDRDD